MKKLIISLFLFASQISPAQCTIAVSSTLTPAAFRACSPITINVGASLYVNGAVSLSGSTTMTIINNGSLTIGGDLSATGNSTFDLSGTGTTQINGNISGSGNFSLNANGGISVSGNATFSGTASVSGTGSLTTAGTTSTSGSATVFGGTGSCTGCTTSSGAPLPIELLSFNATYGNNNMSLSWTTATEINNKYFTIERSIDGKKFSEIATIPSKALNGNSTVKLDYKATDANPLSGISYYRLKQTDYNGKFERFSAISCDFTKQKAITFTVYPNPNSGQFKADFTGVENNHEVQILMHDEHGKLVYSNSFYVHESSNSIDIIPVQKIGKGIYFCSLIVEGIKQTVKVIVN